MSDHDDFDDDYSGAEERFGGRKERRRPKGGRRLSELVESPGEKTGAFSDPGLQALHSKGLLLELQQQVRGGKEATVYRALGPEGPLAAKVYSDEEARTFQADEAYLTGRSVGDRRLRKMLGDARRRGLSPRLAHWVFHEYRMLWRLTEAGLPVPRPAIGPDPHEMITAGRVVLMEWIGDDEPAPRLAESKLEPDEVRTAWSGARKLLVELLELDLVHGDLSTYNLLWWRNDLVLIDLPQVVEVGRNPHAADLLERDVRSLCSSFRAFGVEQDPAQLLVETRLAAGLPPSGPLERD